MELTTKDVGTISSIIYDKYTIFWLESQVVEIANFFLI